MLPGAPPPPGGSEVVDWITSSTRRGRTITAAIPPTYARYATVVVPDGDTAKTLADAALVEVLQAHTPAQPWWLGYLDTGVADLVAADALKVAVYVGWPYVLLEGGAGARSQRTAQPRRHPLAQRSAGTGVPERPLLARLHVVG